MVFLNELLERLHDARWVACVLSADMQTACLSQGASSACMLFSEAGPSFSHQPAERRGGRSGRRVVTSTRFAVLSGVASSWTYCTDSRWMLYIVVLIGVNRK